MKPSVARLAAPAQELAPPRPLSCFEFWPDWLFYAPIAAQWIVLGLRYGDLSLPTAANPSITAGGLCGESKLEILDLVTGPSRNVLARYTGIVTDRRDTREDISAADAALPAAQITYPLVAKPDIGCNGAGVRLISDRAGLIRYFSEFPRGERVLLQELVPYEGEAGLFYVRHPDDAVGRVTSITLKYAPTVMGDGHSTLRELILADPRAGRVPHLYLSRLAHQLQRVPQQGERVRLVFVGNHCKGSIFRDRTNLCTPELTVSVERIARSTPGFYFGRIDVRFSALPALLRGEGFRIIEINGVGSEATHIWDATTTLREAWGAQFRHYAAAFRIAARNRERGHRPTGVSTMIELWRRQRRLMSAYPIND